MDDILEFIGVFDSPSNKILFTEVSCYWFAMILKERFSGNIVYNPHQVHFATKIGSKVYDITGIIEDSSDYVDWNKYSTTAEDSDLIEECCIRLERR